MARLRIELFGVARARAGCAALEVEARNLGEALRALERSRPALSPEIVAQGRLSPSYLASVNGERFVVDDQTPLREGDFLLILSAQAGG